MTYSPHQSSYFAHRITLEGLGDDALAQSLSTARVDMNPHRVVQAKATAAVKWCKAATAHAARNGGKPWSYILIPDNQILANASLAGLENRYARA